MTFNLNLDDHLDADVIFALNTFSVFLCLVVDVPLKLLVDGGDQCVKMQASGSSE
jgi:hypothetical protein